MVLGGEYYKLKSSEQFADVLKRSEILRSPWEAIKLGLTFCTGKMGVNPCYTRDLNVT